MLLFCHCKHLNIVKRLPSQQRYHWPESPFQIQSNSQLIYVNFGFNYQPGTYQGQWLRGLRHGYGVRTSAPFGMASRFRPKSIRSSMTSLKSDVVAGHHGGGGGGLLDPAADRDKRLDDGRGGFVLKSRSDEPPARRRSFSERSSTIKKTLFQVFSCVSFVFCLFCFECWLVSSRGQLSLSDK